MFIRPLKECSSWGMVDSSAIRARLDSERVTGHDAGNFRNLVTAVRTDLTLHNASTKRANMNARSFHAD